MGKIYIPKTLTEVIDIVSVLGKYGGNVSLETAGIMYDWENVIKSGTDIIIFDNAGGNCFYIWTGKHVAILLDKTEKQYLYAWRRNGIETIYKFPYINKRSGYLSWGMADSLDHYETDRMTQE